MRRNGVFKHALGKITRIAERMQHEMSHFTYIATGFVLWNIITFLLYRMDKRRAQNNEWRISEATLVGCAFLMGGVGSLLGMNVFRHKTKHVKFKVLIPLAVIVNVGVLLYLHHVGMLGY